MRGPLLVVLLVVATACVVSGQSHNLSCYQCTADSYQPCPESDLLPCPPNKDRCVTHVTREEGRGLRVGRECGLGLCGFHDDAMNRGLGLDQLCDTSRASFSCLLCCTVSGCNRDASAAAPGDSSAPLLLLLIALAIHTVATVLQ